MIKTIKKTLILLIIACFFAQSAGMSYALRPMATAVKNETPLIARKGLNVAVFGKLVRIAAKATTKQIPFKACLAGSAVYLSEDGFADLSKVNDIDIQYKVDDTENSSDYCLTFIRELKIAAKRLRPKATISLEKKMSGWRFAEYQMKVTHYGKTDEIMLHLFRKGKFETLGMPRMYYFTNNFSEDSDIFIKYIQAKKDGQKIRQEEKVVKKIKSFIKKYLCFEYFYGYSEGFERDQRAEDEYQQIKGGFLSTIRSDNPGFYQFAYNASRFQEYCRFITHNKTLTPRDIYYATQAFSAFYPEGESELREYGILRGTFPTLNELKAAIPINDTQKYITLIDSAA